MAYMQLNVFEGDSTCLESRLYIHMCATDPNKGWRPMFRRRRRECIQAETQIIQLLHILFELDQICVNFFYRLDTCPPNCYTDCRWRETDTFKSLIDDMGISEAKRRRYL